MTIHEIFLVIVALAIICITFALVPVLFQLKKTIRKAEVVMDSVDRQLSPLLTTLNQTSNELNTLSGSINKKLDETDTVLRNLRLAGESLLLTSTLFRRTVSPLITQVGGLGSGIRAFLSVLDFTTSHKSRREDTHNE